MHAKSHAGGTTGETIGEPKSKLVAPKLEQFFLDRPKVIGLFTPVFPKNARMILRSLQPRLFDKHLLAQVRVAQPEEFKAFVKAFLLKVPRHHLGKVRHLLWVHVILRLWKA